ncbi:MAG: C69 family dipeptidase [Bacteroidales bacterium]|nr:C69 family dipeptidase [Bacteroidales bacterium]
MKHIFLLIFITISFFSFSQNNISENCFTIAVGKDASATGSVLIAHNEDDWGQFSCKFT